MALPDFFKVAAGTPIIWGQAGATGISLTVTHALSLNNLANGAGRMGVAVDLGADYEGDYLAQLLFETGTAPAAANAVELWFAWSHNNITWPGKVTGLDAAYPATVLTNKMQLSLPAVLLLATSDANTVLIQQPNVIRAKARYVAPVVVNLLGQAGRNEGTATDNDSRVVLTPLFAKVVE